MINLYKIIVIFVATTGAINTVDASMFDNAGGQAGSEEGQIYVTKIISIDDVTGKPTQALGPAVERYKWNKIWQKFWDYDDIFVSDVSCLPEGAFQLFTTIYSARPQDGTRRALREGYTQLD
jgi:hypothetical protein